MSPKKPIAQSDPHVLNGTPVFVGTRVPVASLFDYLVSGRGLDEFLADFPSVTRKQAIAALEFGRETVRAQATSP